MTSRIACSLVSSGFGLRYSSSGSMRAYLGGTQINMGGQNVVAGDTIVYSFRYEPLTSEMRFWESKNASVTTATVAPADFSNGHRIGFCTKRLYPAHYLDEFR